MSYYVELSYDLRKHKSSDFKKKIYELGEKYDFEKEAWPGIT